MSKLLTWLSVSFNWYTHCVYTTPPTVTCGGGLPCAVNWATPAAVATTATPSARRVENVIGWLPSWGMGCGWLASDGKRIFACHAWARRVERAGNGRGARAVCAPDAGGARNLRGRR